MNQDLQQYVPNVYFEQIPIKNLVSNQEYQRHLSIKHVQKAAKNFDLYQVNPVKVSRRNGTNYVFNGQHTVEIIALVSGSRETPVWCMIYDDLVYEHEADIFANQMKYVKPLLPYETFMAHIEAGSDKHLLIKGLVESYDLSITPSKAPGGICAVGALESIYDRYGYHILEKTLRLIIGTWEGDVISLSGNMLNGIARLAYAYDEQLKEDLFKEKLSKVSPKDVSRTAKERRAGSLGYAEALLIFYNKNKKYPLSYERLYTNKAPVRKRSTSVVEDYSPNIVPNDMQSTIFDISDAE